MARIIPGEAVLTAEQLRARNMEAFKWFAANPLPPSLPPIPPPIPQPPMRVIIPGEPAEDA